MGRSYTKAANLGHRAASKVRRLMWHHDYSGALEILTGAKANVRSRREGNRALKLVRLNRFGLAARILEEASDLCDCPECGLKIRSAFYPKGDPDCSPVCLDCFIENHDKA